MSNSWANVHSFLDMMDNQDLHSPLSSSLSSFSSSSISNCSLQPLSIEAKRWHEAERVAQQLLFIIQPNKDSENRREEIIEYLQTLIEDAFGIKVFPFGSVPLKTYLPDGDIDLTAINHFSSTQDLATEICSLLENEAKNNTSFRVKNVLCVPAQVRVVKCTVDGIRVDISFNQTAGLCALYFFEQVDRFIGKDHLFKRSVILIKAWCYYESRILGGFHGLISTYALETMVLHVINLFHSSLQCPLAVLNKFLEYYGTFDWNSYCVGFNGLVLLSSFPDMIVQPPPECDEPLLTDAFLWSSREAILSSMGVGPTNASFTKKFLNILDPLRDDNNLGRSVSKGNFYRIQSALSYGAGKLSDILMLPVENIQNGLEKFFKDTLMINGKRRRGDVVVPVSTYDSEIPDDHSGHDHLFSRIDYGLWFQDHGMIYPAAPETSKNHEVWNHKWIETGHNVQFDHNMYYNFNKSPRSLYSLTSFAASNAASGNEKPKSRGTGTFIPYIRRILRRNKTLERNEHNRWREPEYVKENEIEKEYEVIKMVDAVDYPAYNPSEANMSLDEAGNIDAFNFSIKEFPVLPGGKPIPIEVAALSVCPETTLIKEPSASLDDSLEFDSFKHSSPRSMLSEAGKHSESDETVILDLVGDPSSVTVPEDPESSESVEKLVVPVEALQLADDLEFPPLSRPPEPVITLNKKEFPPLRSCLKSNKRNKSRKDFKEAQ